MSDAYAKGIWAQLEHVSDDFNALPFEARQAAGKVLDRQRIQQLLFERDRLCKRHAKSLFEIDDQIKAIMRELKP